MFIPKTLLTKTTSSRFRGKIERILEEGWNYLSNCFKDQDDYFDFLNNLSEDQREKFFHTIFFYWAHDLHRIIEKEVKDPNIDGFMYQTTLSIIEYLNEDISNRSRERIKDFFTRYFSDSGKIKLKQGIRALSHTNATLPQIESWEILYDMRNKFIHRAGWFNMRFGGGFTCLSVIKRRNGSEYIADIRINFVEYLELFWEAYLKYFGKV